LGLKLAYPAPIHYRRPTDTTNRKSGHPTEEMRTGEVEVTECVITAGLAEIAQKRPSWNQQLIVAAVEYGVKQKDEPDGVWGQDEPEGR